MLPLLVQSKFVPIDRTLHPEGLNIHAVLLRQAFAHCAKFPTAASRRSMGRVSVPLWLIILPLKPATDHRLGSPLHHQQANQVQAHLRAPELSRLVFQPSSYGVLAEVSLCCPPP